MTEYWFRPKRYGYGATPSTWQGWAMLLGTVAGMIAVSVLLRRAEQNYWGLAAMFVFDALALAFLFIVVQRKTEGGFHWHWGGRQARR